MNSIVELQTNKEYQEQREKPGVLILYFGSITCPPCRKLKPNLHLLADAWGEDIKIVDATKVKEACDEFAVRSIPALVFLKDGGVREKGIGYRTYNQLVQSVTNLIG